jgi:hypothetical protein
MKNTLVVVTDLGGFKAYRLDKDQQYSTPHLELLEEFSNDAALGRLVDRVSDLSGRFPRRTAPGAASAMSDGERHNIHLEQRKRAVRRLATRLNSLMSDPEIERCYLAASREINHQLLEELDSPVRAKIGLNIPADYMKLGKAELVRHFV